jgi:Uma2 family endonuclease
MSRPIKGINVLSKHDPDMFNKILGHEEYRLAINKANGDVENLKHVFWDVLADDYHWEFIKGEIVLRCGMTIKNAIAKQNLQMFLWNFVKKKKIGQVFGARCVCDFGDDFFSPDIIYYENSKADKFYNEMNRFPVPDLIIEFNDENTEEHNRGIKFDAYESKGVKEYFMVNTENKTIEQYILDKGTFDFIGLIVTGKVNSTVIRGCEFSIEDIFEQ